MERLPLPSLKTYTAISVTLIACAVYYAHQVVTEERENTNNTEIAEATNSSTNITNIQDEDYIVSVVHILSQEAWCIWVSNLVII